MEAGLQSKFNLAGSKKRNIAEKQAFGKTRVYRVIIGTNFNSIFMDA